MRLMKSKLSFENYVNNFLCYSKKTFHIDRRLGSKKVVWDDEKKLGAMYRKPMTPEAQKQAWVFSQVRQSFSRYIKKNPNFKVYKPVSSTKKDRPRFDKLKKGQKFLATDGNHFYWRMAYNLGYISENLYNKLCQPEFKLIRNKALACLASATLRDRYVDGVYVDTINIGNPQLGQLYKNVRYKSYALMKSCMIALGKDFLKYKVDCVYYMPIKRKLVESIFIANNMQFGTQECMVIDKKYFIEGKDLKKF